MSQKAHLILSNGDQFEGELIGFPLETSGEMVFTTGMVGYTEAITDPSYYGQLLVFAYPLIGNYGVPKLSKDPHAIVPQGFESRKANAAGVILSIDSEEAFHWNSTENLDHWLKANEVPAIIGLDTRHLVQLIRSTPRLLGKIIPERPEKTLRQDFFDPSSTEVLKEVSTPRRELIGTGSPKIAIIDCGVKWNIIRQLLELGCQVELIPPTDDFSSVECDAWLVSNGPGDPKKTGTLIEKVQALLATQEKPLLGICLGHQILSLAAGAETTRMDYGHRSHNQPVNLVGTRRGFITSQNHGYVVVEKSLPPDWEPWFRNANDNTIEGIRHKTRPIASVQFHPEAAGGPRDTGWILKEFVEKTLRKE